MDQIKQRRQASQTGLDMPQRFSSFQDALCTVFGEDTRVERSERIAGGDINEAYGLTLSDGTRVFMKSNAKENASFFTAEALGLAAIARTGTIGTPRLLGFGTDAGKGGYAFLLMEFIGRSKRIADHWEVFAQELAAMHRAGVSAYTSGGSYGFLADNYIGAGEQINTVQDSWIGFFRDRRLRPQFQRAARYFGASERKKISSILEHMDRILVEPDHPSLLHGDLWSGNVITGNDGRAWLIDPAVYVGHAEADLAMTELFGGFPQEFYRAYKEAAPLQPGYERRRDVYNLYHLLNHLNLFGRAYLGSVMGMIERIGT